MKLRELRDIMICNYKLVNYSNGKEINNPITLEEHKKVNEMEVVSIKSKLKTIGFVGSSDIQIESYVVIELLDESEL